VRLRCFLGTRKRRLPGHYSLGAAAGRDGEVVVSHPRRRHQGGVNFSTQGVSRCAPQAELRTKFEEACRHVGVCRPRSPTGSNCMASATPVVPTERGVSIRRFLLLAC